MPWRFSQLAGWLVYLSGGPRHRLERWAAKTHVSRAGERVSRPGTAPHLAVRPPAGIQRRCAMHHAPCATDNAATQGTAPGHIHTEMHSTIAAHEADKIGELYTNRNS